MIFLCTVNVGWDYSTKGRLIQEIRRKMETPDPVFLICIRAGGGVMGFVGSPLPTGCRFRRKRGINKEMAATLGLSINTVKGYLKLLERKMGASSRCGIIARLLTESSPAS